MRNKFKKNYTDNKQDGSHKSSRTKESETVKIILGGKTPYIKMHFYIKQNALPLATIKVGILIRLQRKKRTEIEI